MKKAKIFFIVSLLVLCIGTMMLACDPVIDVDKIVVDSTSIETQYLVGEPFDFSKIKVKAYKDGVESAVAFSQLTFSDFSTETAGDFDLTVSFGDFKDVVKMKVYSLQRDVNFEVLSFEEPEQITAYKENIKVKGENSKRSEFMDRADGYYVGTANEYVLKPVVLARKTIGDSFYLFAHSEYPSVITVEKKDGADFTELTGDALSDMVTVDAGAGTFRFKAEAEGETFKLNFSASEDEDELQGSFSHTVTIMDGYNAHNLAQLSAVDNENKGGVWTSYKAEHNIPMPATPFKAVILHGDVTITKADLPAAYFWAEDGSLLDWTNVYNRIVKEDEHFDLVGNYYTVDAREIPLITRDNNEGEKLSDDNNVVVISNANLFHFYADDYDDKGSVAMKNFNLIGNAPRSDDKKYSGGLTMMHCDIERFDAYNNIATRFVTMYNAMNGVVRDNVLKMVKTKSYDSFNSIVYMWNASYVYIEKSELIGSGSPVIIISNPYGDHENETLRNRTARLIVDKFSHSTADGSIVETQVTGQETWFQINGASAMAGQLTALSSGIEEMSRGVSAGIAAATGGAVQLPVRSYHKIDKELALFNPRVLIYPDTLDKNYYTKGEVYEGTENPTHNTAEWETLLKMEEMISEPSSAPIAALGGASQQYLLGKGSPYITSRGGEVSPALMAMGLGLPPAMPATGIAVYQDDTVSDFVFADRLASSFATDPDPTAILNYLGFFLGDHLSIYLPIVYPSGDSGTPDPTSIGILLEYYSTPYVPA